VVSAKFPVTYPVVSALSILKSARVHRTYLQNWIKVHAVNWWLALYCRTYRTKPLGGLMRKPENWQSVAAADGSVNDAMKALQRGFA
jgi:hypothetical protein